MLLAMERGTVSQYKGMTLDDIEIDPEGLGMFLIFNLFNTGMVTWCFYKGCTRFCLQDSECCCFNFDYFPLVLSFLPEKVPQSNEGDSSDTSEGESTSSEMEHTMDTSVSSAPSASSTPAHAVTPPIQG